MHLAIVGPTRDTVPASFAVDLAQLYAHTREHGPWSPVTVGFVAATYIHAGREFILESCLQQGATHLLWLDTDMSFPPETAVRLMRHGLTFVGCNYVTRQDGGMFTARRGNQRIETRAYSTGLESVDGIGFGAVLMHADIARVLPRPWFQHGRNDAGGDIGEDLMFCRALRRAGYEIFIDHDLSKEIGHVGQQIFRTVQNDAAVAQV